MLAAVGCCCRLLMLADGQGKRMHNGRRHSCIRRSDGGHVVEVCVEIFLRDGKVIGVCAGNLDQRVGLTTCERDCSSHSATPATATHIDAGIPDSVSSPSGKVERRSSKPKRLRQDMRWQNDCGAITPFSTHDTHADLIQQAFSLEPMLVHG